MLSERALLSAGMLGALFMARCQGVAGEPQTAEVWFARGEALLGQDDYGGAAAAYQRAAELGYGPARVQARLGKCFGRSGLHREAEGAYRLAVAAAPDDVAARFGLAVAVFRQKKPAEALPLFEPLATRDDEWGEAALEYLAECCLETDACARAIALLEPALRKSPGNTTTRWLLARSLYKSERYGEALPHFQALAAGTGAKAEAARFYAAASLEGQGRVREALQEYREVAGGQSEWAGEAQKAARGLSGNPLRLLFDFSGGVDTNVITAEAERGVGGGKDYYTQQYLDVAGRPFDGQALNLWLGYEHFGLLYTHLHQSDYLQDAGRATLNFPAAGPFANVAFEYKLRFSQLDYQPFRLENRAEASATYQDSVNRLRFGLAGMLNDYCRGSKGLSGTEISGFADYRLRLPAWDHELRLRCNADRRWSEDEAWSRATQRVRLRYRAQVWKPLYWQAEGTYRHDDYPSSAGRSGFTVLNRREDRRLTGEVRLDAQLHRQVLLYGSYLYEAQDSTRRDDRYHRHQISAGFTVTY